MERQESVMKKSEIRKIDEDFGMGVGTPLGVDQGIPYGGDGKAVYPCYMGMTSRFRFCRKECYWIWKYIVSKKKKEETQT